MNQPNPAVPADQKNLKGLKHTIATLDEIQRRPYLTANLIQMGYMIITYPNDMPAVLSHTAGMSHVYHEGSDCCAIVAGTMQQWISSCERACRSEADQVIRYVFNKVYRHLEQNVPRELLTGCTKDFGDGTFLLEDHR